MSLTSEYYKAKRAINASNRKDKDTLTKEFVESVKSRTYEDIAPIYSPETVWANSNFDAPVKKKKKLDFFQMGAFEDGFDWSDIPKVILGTAGDAGLEVVRGAGGLVEGITDLATYGAAGVADWVGADDKADKWRKNAQKRTLEGWTQGADDFLEKYSILGSTSDAILQGVGQVGGIMATGGLGAAAGLGSAAVTALTTGTMFASGMGSGMGEAYQGGATDEEAATYGLISGAADAISEMLFGGMGKGVKALGLSHGLSSADDMLAKAVSSKFKNQIAKNFAEFGIKASGEGVEEVLAGIAQAAGKKATYMSEKDWKELLEDENLLEQFVVGSVASGIMQAGVIPGTKSGSLSEANKEGRDFITGLNQNEQTVIKLEVEKRIAEREKNGEKLTNKQKNAIEEDVISDMDKGRISIETIEEALGGESYKAYKDTVDKEDAIFKEYDELGKLTNATLAQQSRYKELEQLVPGLKEKNAREGLQEKLRGEVLELVKGDRLVESYNEYARKGQRFETDASKYDNEFARNTVQEAINSGVLNNTRRSHEIVASAAKLSADKKVPIKFVNNKMIADMGRSVEGKIANGFMENGVMHINVESPRYKEFILGHEITHTFEGDKDLYKPLQDTLFKLAQEKGEYDSRLEAIEKMYKGMKVDPKAELTADLVGDYLFSDDTFIQRLSVENRNLFQKIYDEIKYMCRVFTAGSKEAREFEKLKIKCEKAFENAYRNVNSTQADTNVSAQDTAEYGVIEYILEKGRVSNTLANEIINDPAMASAFTDITGVTLEGTTEQKRSLIRNAVRDHQMRTAENEALTMEAAEQAYAEDAKAQEEQAVRDSGYRSYIRGIFQKGATVADAREILHNPDMKAEWEAITQKTLPANEKSAVKMILETKRDPNKIIPQGDAKYSISDTLTPMQAQMTNIMAANIVSEARKNNVSLEQYYTATEEINAYNPTKADVLKIADSLEPIVNQLGVDNYYGYLDKMRSYAAENQDSVKYSISSDSDGTPINEVTENGLTMTYVRVPNQNTQHYGSTYGQNIEPAGEYMSMDTMQGKNKIDGYEYGTIQFKKPLVLEHIDTSDKGWKKTVSDMYNGLTGKKLTKALIKDGYDAIVTYDDYGYNEIVNLNGTKISEPNSDADIRYSLSDANGRELSPAVQKRFSNSKVVDDSGKLKPVYHGTYAGEFTIFDKAKGSVEGDFGSGFYFTDNNADVSDHYEGGGPDYENKVIRRAEQIMNEEDTEWDEAEERARNELFKGSHKFEVYLNIENPAVVGETMLFSDMFESTELNEDDFEDYDEYYDAVSEECEEKISEILWEVERSCDVDSTDGIAEVLWNAVNDGGIGIEELKAQLNDLYLEDSEGNFVANEVARQIIESLGYDGIVDPTVSGKWNMNMEAGTTHYIAFKPNQIKAVTNQNPTDNPDIRYSLSAPSVDDSTETWYNNSSNLGPIGGISYDGTGSIEDSERGLAGLQQRSGAVAVGGAFSPRNTSASNILRISPALNSAYQKSGVVPTELIDSSSDSSAFSVALDRARKADVTNGWAVTPKEVEDLVGVKTFMEANGGIGAGVAPDGDIVAVFKNPNSGIKRALHTIIPSAIDNGGTKLDCYGRMLVLNYAKYGFVPVARVPFNPEYANDGWDESKGRPDIYFMMYDGTDGADAINRYGTHKLWTQADLDALPLFEGEDGYDKAMAYRDNLLAQKKNAEIAPTRYSLTKQGETPDTHLGLPADHIVYDENIAPIKSEVTTDKSGVTTDSAKVITDAPIKDGNANPSVAKVLTKEPKSTKQKRNVGLKAVSAVVDKGMVFENLSLKTGNMELQSKWDYALPSKSEARAQYLMKNGDKGVKSLDAIRKEVGKEKEQAFSEYLYHVHNIDRMSLDARFGVENKAVFGDSVTAEDSQRIVAEMEEANPEFESWAKDVYTYNKHLRKMLVDKGVISQETSDLWEKMYPHYVPVRRVDQEGLNINVPLDTNKTGVNAPVKRATGGSSDILPLFDTMAQRTIQTYKAIARNDFGVELKNTLNSAIESEAPEKKASVDDVIDSIDFQEELLKPGQKGGKPTFTVFENGERVEFEIDEDMYNALKPANGLLGHTFKGLNAVSNARRNLITSWNPVFALYRNPIKDIQDVLINSQHPAKTYLNVPKAIFELATNGEYAAEYHKNGGDQNTYFESDTNTFKAEDNLFKKAIGMPIRALENAGNFIEQIPRLAEFIASRKNGRSVERSMLDAARVTTNFAAGGDVTKFANRHGFTFLNASVQGASQHVRNIREAKMNGFKGWVKLAAKVAVAGLPHFILNGLMWEDDEEYAELSDYVKDNYYIVAKTEDGKFIRIPKGRVAAVIQDGFEQMENLITGDDEADFGNFFKLVIDNLAPNNPLENNILAPIGQAINNKAWYGDELVPSRLQDLPAAEQYDESTDSISKWLGEKTGLSPYKINYLLDQYSGGVGDVFLPMLTPEAESGDDSFKGNMLAPWKKELVTDSVLNNQNVTDFYDLRDELEVNANSMYATQDDEMKNLYMDAVGWDMSDLYKKKREIQNSDMSDSTKYEMTRELQRQIDELAKEGLNGYNDVNVDGNYAEIGGRRFNRDAEKDTWYEIQEKNADGSDNYFYQQEQNVTKALGISYGEYWNNRDEYDFAYKKPERYAIAKAVGGYDSYLKYYGNNSFESNGEMSGIKADKDENGKSINGSRKEKILDYLNELDADYGEKIILFKSQYPADDSYNYEIIDYLNGRDDISYDDMKKILVELGFEVDDEGYIRW